MNILRDHNFWTRLLSSATFVESIDRVCETTYREIRTFRKATETPYGNVEVDITLLLHRTYDDHVYISSDTLDFRIRQRKLFVLRGKYFKYNPVSSILKVGQVQPPKYNIQYGSDKENVFPVSDRFSPVKFSPYCKRSLAEDAFTGLAIANY